MTPSQDAMPLRSPQYPDLDASILLPKRRQSPASSIASLPYERSNPSLSSLFASTTSLPPSRPSSGSTTPTATVVARSIFSPVRANGAASTVNFPQTGQDEVRRLILRGFVPHVAVLASADTEGIMREKAFYGGFLQLIRPYGELIAGKVTIRDSTGASRSWEDYGIRFVGLLDGLGIQPRRSLEPRTEKSNGFRDSSEGAPLPRPQPGGDIAQIEEAVDRHLMYSELQSDVPTMDYASDKDAPAEPEGPPASPFYTLYLRRLLSGLPMTPHETFSHPVACVIAISSRNPHPIEELRRLYASTNEGNLRLPQWVNNDYLRYYVLVHDEDHDDISKSTALFEQMKRHFGLHCHLLRLRSSQCVPSDDDSVRLPICEWISAGEELAEIQRREAIESVEDPTPYLFESDATAIRTFVRELVTQSVIPTMERLSATWNEQVVSRRRGISGRFMSLSKRWTGFGSSSRSSSSLSSGSSSSNYDTLQGFYRPEAPETTMRKLADYAFMLRDFRLAQSTYELLRSDFNNDKAWKHYAGAHEMTALSILMNSHQTLTSKTRTEAIDQMLETACYSYLTRCAAPYNALRTLSLALELLKLRSASAADDAARWAVRILEQKLVGPIGHALFTERISICYASRRSVGRLCRLGLRRRKAALWAVLAAEAWVKLEKSVQAEKCLDEAGRHYGINIAESQRLPCDGMQNFVEELREGIVATRLAAQGYDPDDDGMPRIEEPEEREDVVEDMGGRPHRKSLIGAGGAPFGGLDAPPLSPNLGRDEDIRTRDDSFE